MLAMWVSIVGAQSGGGSGPMGCRVYAQPPLRCTNLNLKA